MDREVKILFVGETGSGKSTLINMLANAICGRGYEDQRLFAIPCRLKYEFECEEKLQKIIKTQDCNIKEFIDLSSEATGGDDGSKTTHPNFYRFKDRRTGKVITLIDTPGLSDTRGSAFDDRHIESITHAIMDAKGINLICIVHNATESRLKLSIRISIQRIKEIFTEDSIEKIFAVCLTNSPKNIAPNCLDALKELGIPLDNTFRFENCCLVPPDLFRQQSKHQSEDAKQDVEEIISINKLLWSYSNKSSKNLLAHAEKMQLLETYQMLNIAKPDLLDIICIIFQEVLRVQNEMQLDSQELQQIDKSITALPLTLNSTSVMKIVSANLTKRTFIRSVKKPLNDQTSSLSKARISGSTSKNTKDTRNDGLSLDTNGYFVWVDVPYEKEVNDWRVDDLNFDLINLQKAKQIAAENLRTARKRKSELQEHFQVYEAQMLNNYQIAKSLLDNFKKKEKSSNFSPEAFIDELEAEIKSLNNLRTSDIFRDSKKELKREFLRHLERFGGDCHFFPRENAALAQQLGRVDNLEDIPGKATREKLQSLFEAFKEVQRNVRRSKIGRLVAFKDSFKKVLQMKTIELSKQQRDIIDELMRGQFESKLTGPVRRFDSSQPFTFSS